MQAAAPPRHVTPPGPASRLRRRGRGGGPGRLTDSSRGRRVWRPGSGAGAVAAARSPPAPARSRSARPPGRPAPAAVRRAPRPAEGGRASLLRAGRRGAVRGAPAGGDRTGISGAVRGLVGVGPRGSRRVRACGAAAEWGRCSACSGVDRVSPAPGGFGMEPVPQAWGHPRTPGGACWGRGAWARGGNDICQAVPVCWLLSLGGRRTRCRGREEGLPGGGVRPSTLPARSRGARPPDREPAERFAGGTAVQTRCQERR